MELPGSEYFQVANHNFGDTGPINWRKVKNYIGMMDEDGKRKFYNIYKNCIPTHEFIKDPLTGESYQVYNFFGDLLLFR
jgi:hypothetical protein